MAGQTLRPYQASAWSNVLARFNEGARRVLLTLPTAGGKTTIFCHAVQQLFNKGLPSIVLVHRRELAGQAANRLREWGVPFGYIMAGEPRKPGLAQIASVQTLVRRAVPPASLVICDEAHLSTAASWQTILQAYPHARVLGVTATPWRLGGKPLIGSYDASVVAATPAELREQGYLAPYVGFSYRAPDLSQVKTTGGDYNEKQSAEAMKAPQIVASVVSEWLKHASTLSTVVFAVTVDHSKQLCAEFKAAGVTAEHLDGTTPLEMRKAILKRVDAGTTKVLCNVGVAVEGLDIPRLKCCVLARPTMSLARAIQMMGRVRRPWQGVTARIHDHSFCVSRHGLPDDERDYTLSSKQADPPSLSTCSECLALYRGSVCPNCSHENEREAAGERVLVTVPDAEQFEFGSGGEGVAEVRPPVEVKWNDIGKVIEGVFRGSAEVTTEYGKEWRHRVEGKRDYILPGTVELNAMFKRRKAGDQVRVTHVRNDDLGGGRQKKRFRIEVDDGKDWDALKAEALRLYVEEKQSCATVGATLGISNRTVNNWARAAGVGRSYDEAIAPDTQTVARAVALYEENRTTTEVATILGVGETTVYEWVKSAGKLRSRGSYTATDPQTVSEIVRLYTVEKMAPRAISERLGVGQTTIHDHLRAKGLTRSNSEAQKLRAQQAAR